MNICPGCGEPVQLSGTFSTDAAPQQRLRDPSGKNNATDWWHSGCAVPTPPPLAADAQWVAVDEKGNDNFATSIYENDRNGLLVARCNQNGNHPWQAAAILCGLERNRQATSPDAVQLAQRYEKALVQIAVGQNFGSTLQAIAAKALGRTKP